MKPADWQHVIGIDDTAYSFQPFDNYTEAVEFCQRNGGKVFEPTKRTNNPVFKWAKEKNSPNEIWLGIEWSKNQSQFQYQSNGRKISWANFHNERRINYTNNESTNTSCGYRPCLDDEASVVMLPQSGKWIVKRKSESYGYICETTVS